MFRFNFTSKVKTNDFIDFINNNKELKVDWIGPGIKIVYPDSDGIMNNDSNMAIIEDDYLITDWFTTQPKPDNNIGPNFLYKINSHGFRSIHFEKINKNKISMLTAGCSQTFGHCLPNELRWANMLASKIDQNNMQHFDLSSLGASIELIVKNIFSFIRNYGSPNYIFINFPDMYRGFRFDEKHLIYRNVFANEKTFTKSDLESSKKFTLSFLDQDGYMNAVTNILALEDLCNAKNIKLFWSSWSDRLLKIGSVLNFNNFVLYESEFANRWDNNSKNTNIPENINNLDYWRSAHDEQHFGSFWNLSVSNMFLEALKNDKEN